ncbi:MAG: hypothetical protein ACXVZI_02275 [Terriglobales bacterium]
MRKIIVLLLAISMAAAAAAQSSSPPPRYPSRPPVSGPPAGTPATNTADVANLAKLDQVIESARVDLARLRVDKWKTDANTKRQAEANADSIQRNMTTALPGIVQQVRANPNSVGATFKLYRNLNALYDVMSSLTESVGAFGSKDDYQALGTDTANLDTFRRALADQVEMMATARDTEVAQLQARARQAAATAATPPKKVVIDDNEAEKKPAKKTTKKKTTTASDGSQNPPR